MLYMTDTSINVGTVVAHHLTVPSEGLGLGDRVFWGKGSEGTSNVKGSGDPSFNLGLLQGQ